MPILVYLLKQSNPQQLLRSLLCTALFAYLINFKNSHLSALFPSIALLYALAPELTGFSTATALIFILSLKNQSYSLSNYIITQLLLIILGGLYELLILSDYGSIEDHGRSIYFWTGQGL